MDQDLGFLIGKVDYVLDFGEAPDVLCVSGVDVHPFIINYFIYFRLLE